MFEKQMNQDEITMVNKAIKYFENDYVHITWDVDRFDNANCEWVIIIKILDMNNGNMIARRCALPMNIRWMFVCTPWIAAIGKCISDMMYRLGMNTK